MLDGEWLEGLYNPSELKIRKVLSLPWQCKGGKITYWSARRADENEKEAPRLRKATAS